MPRYHFHAADGSVFRDEEGEELPDLDAARAVAVDVLVQMLPLKAEALWKHKTFTVNVKDETGRLVASITTLAAFDPVARADAPPEI